MLRHLITILISKYVVEKVSKDYEQNQKDNLGTLKPPKSIFVIGVVCMAIVLAIIVAVLVLASKPSDKIIAGVVLGVFFLMGLFLALFSANYNVQYREGEIIYRNTFRKTSRYLCNEIKHAYYTDTGCTKFVFENGKKLKFGQEEKHFCAMIMKREHLKYEFEGEENAVVTVYISPILTVPLWIACLSIVFCSFFDLTVVPYAIFMLLFSLGLQLSYTTYDTENKILIRRKCGFKKKCNMTVCDAKPVYQGDFMVGIEVYEGRKKLTKVPVFREYKNRARLIKTFFGIYG